MIRTALAALLSLGALSTPALADHDRSYTYDRDDAYDRRVDEGQRDGRWNDGRWNDTRWNSDSRYDRQDDYRYGYPYDDRYDRDANGWIRLSAPQRVSDSYDHRVSVPIDLRAPRVRQLRVQSIGDSMLVRQVAVELENGQVLKVRPERSLWRDGGMTIDLGRRVEVRRVLVYGRNRSDASAFVISGR